MTVFRFHVFLTYSSDILLFIENETNQGHRRTTYSERQGVRRGGGGGGGGGGSNIRGLNRLGSAKAAAGG